jgi:sirohydrochlorin ferrochelatase
MRDPLRSLLIVGHGTHDEQGTAEFHETVKQLSARFPRSNVQPCFLELAQPTIAQAVRQLVDRQVREITVVPLLLFAAGHVKRDIPAAVARAVEQAALGSAPIVVRQAGHLGCHQRVLELSVKRFRQAMAMRNPTGGGPVPARDTLLVMVGRGSTDRQANEEMRRFAELRAGLAPVARTEVCFLAMARPSLQTVLNQVVQSPYRRIVVQPHLLFHGQLVAQWHACLQVASQQRPDCQWLVARHLGPDPLLVDAIADRAGGECTELLPNRHVTPLTADR